MIDQRTILLHTTTPSRVEKTMLELMMLDKRNITFTDKITRHCRNAFGFESHIVCIVWNLIISQGSIDLNVYSVLHLLWMLAYFKGYLDEEENISKFKCSGNIFGDKVWYSAERVANLQIVSIYKKFNIIIYSLYMYVLFCL
jgi:hypothetical protein